MTRPGDEAAVLVAHRDDEQQPARAVLVADLAQLRDPDATPDLRAVLTHVLTHTFGRTT